MIVLAKYADEQDSTTFPSVKYLICGGAAIPTSQEKEIHQLMPNCGAVTQCYGMTELLVFASSGLPYYKRGSVGVLHSGGKVKVVSIITGEHLGPNELGEVLVKFDGLCRKYRSPEAVSGMYNIQNFIFLLPPAVAS